MTREEFENIFDVCSLVEAGNEYGFEEIEDCVYCSDSRDDYIEGKVEEDLRNYGWKTVLSNLKSREDEGDYDFYYKCYDGSKFIGITDNDQTFVDLKDKLRDFIFDEYGFDGDDDSEEYYPEPEKDRKDENEFTGLVSEFQVI